MATKQHCDICDSVIPGDESFRVIRYGRGQNYDVQTGNDPKIICKACWAKMWAAVSTEEARNTDNLPSCNNCIHNGTWDCITCSLFNKYERAR